MARRRSAGAAVLKDRRGAPSRLEKGPVTRRMERRNTAPVLAEAVFHEKGAEADKIS